MLVLNNQLGFIFGDFSDVDLHSGGRYTCTDLTLRVWRCLLPVYVKTTGSPYMCNTFECQRGVCMLPMGVNNMYAVHVGAKIMHVYV